MQEFVDMLIVYCKEGRNWWPLINNAKKKQESKANRSDREFYISRVVLFSLFCFCFYFRFLSTPNLKFETRCKGGNKSKRQMIDCNQSDMNVRQSILKHATNHRLAKHTRTT